MSEYALEHDTLPGLYQSADLASRKAQSNYFGALKIYLFLLVVAALISFAWPTDSYGAVVSTGLFLITLGILIYLRVNRPDDTWYNSRAVAESVKTRSWRWVMCAEPYEYVDNIESVSKQFISDLKTILNQNESLSKALEPSAGLKEPISSVMNSIRRLPVEERLALYRKQRLDNQAIWYSKKSQFNKRRSRQWFWVSVTLHVLAIAMLLYRIKAPSVSLPVESVAVATGAVLTWLQAKKHNELNYSYVLAAHQIALIKGESVDVKKEQNLSTFVLDSENAFSREHTQWTARKAV